MCYGQDTQHRIRNCKLIIVSQYSLLSLCMKQYRDLNIKWYSQLKLEMQQPQTCTKCNILPQDILMLACKHDLCLQCAAERLSFEMKKKKPANSIVCEFCYERTPLDADSVNELEKLITVTKVRKPFEQSKYESKAYQPTNIVTKPLQASKISQVSKPRLRSDFPKDQLKKNCGQHPQQQILYFCFDCKCECICPQCIIHGKHKDHEVKTVKKAAPIVKADLDSNLDRIDSHISTLVMKKNQVQKLIRSLTEQSNSSKRQIQSAFDQVRAKIDTQEKELLMKCDMSLNEGLGEMDKATKSILRRIDQLKSYSSAAAEYLKKDQIVMLNFYAKKWKEIGEESKDNTVGVPIVEIKSNERVLTAILDIADSIEKITQEKKYHRNDHQ